MLPHACSKTHYVSTDLSATTYPDLVCLPVVPSVSPTLGFESPVHFSWLLTRHSSSRLSPFVQLRELQQWRLALWTLTRYRFLQWTPRRDPFVHLKEPHVGRLIWLVQQVATISIDYCGICVSSVVVLVVVSVSVVSMVDFAWRLSPLGDQPEFEFNLEIQLQPLLPLLLR